MNSLPSHKPGDGENGWHLMVARDNSALGRCDGWGEDHDPVRIDTVCHQPVTLPLTWCDHDRALPQRYNGSLTQESSPRKGVRSDGGLVRHIPAAVEPVPGRQTLHPDAPVTRSFEPVVVSRSIRADRNVSRHDSG